MGFGGGRENCFSQSGGSCFVLSSLSELSIDGVASGLGLGWAAPTGLGDTSIAGGGEDRPELATLRSRGGDADLSDGGGIGGGSTGGGPEAALDKVPAAGGVTVGAVMVPARR